MNLRGYDAHVLAEMSASWLTILAFAASLLSARSQPLESVSVIPDRPAGQTKRASEMAAIPCSWVSPKELPAVLGRTSARIAPA